MELRAFGDIEVGIFGDAEFVRLSYAHFLRLSDDIVTVHVVLLILLIWAPLLTQNWFSYLVLLVLRPLETFLFLFGQTVLLGIEQIGDVHEVVASLADQIIGQHTSLLYLL